MGEIDLNKLNNQKRNSATSQKEERGTFDFLNKEINLFGSGFNDKKKERFYSELYMLFSAGVDIRSALELIEGGQEKEKDKALFSQIKEAIVSGTSLSKALEQTGMFSPYEFYSLQIGEESGRTLEILKELSVFFEKKIKQKRQLTSALSYPIIILCTSFGTIFFMLKFVVPMFVDVFKRFKGELPYVTRMIIKLSNGVSHYSIYFIIALVTSIIFLHNQRNTIWYRRASANVLIHLPIFKTMITKVYLARFCQSMSLLISAKTPLVTAIELVKKMIEFYPIEVSLDTIQKDIMTGHSLHVGLSKFKIYNKRLISLIKVAEEVNEMDTMFSKLAKQYSDEVEHQTSIIRSLIEPIMLLFLGAVVGFILIAMYLPIFKMSTMMH